MARKKKGIKSKQRSRLKEFSKLKEKQRIMLANNTQQSRPPSSSPEAEIDLPYVDETTSLLTRSAKTPIPDESICESSNNGQSSIAISNLRTLVAPLHEPVSANSNDTATTTYVCIGKSSNCYGSSSALENNHKNGPEPISASRAVSNVAFMSSTLFLAAMDASSILALFGLLSSEFEQLPQGSWMISGCLLSTAISYPLYRKLRIVFGDLFLLQLSLFNLFLGCLCSCLAPNFGIFLLGRCITGSGIGPSLLLSLTPPESQQSNRYVQLRKVAPCVAILCGVVTGIISAGLLTEYNRFKWRGAFMAEAAIALAFMPLVQRFLISSPVSARWREDLKSIRWSKFNAYMFILLCANVPTLFEIRQTSGILVFAVSFCALLCVIYALFLIWKPSNNKLRSGAFKRTVDRCTAIRVLLASMALSATFAYIALYFSILQRLSPIQIGIRMVSGALTIVLGMIIVDEILKVYSVDLVRHIGELIAFVGTLCLVLIPYSISTWVQPLLCVLPALGLTIVLITTARASNTAAKVSPLVRTAGFSVGVCWAGLVFHIVLWKQLVKHLAVFEKAGIDRGLLEEYAVNAYHSSEWAFKKSPTLVRSAFITAYTYSCKSVFILALACLVLAVIA